MDFETLYLKYQPGVYRHALRLTHNRELAEDLVADTFEHALKAYYRFDGANPAGWLYRICFNLWVSQRQRKVQFIPLEPEIDGKEFHIQAAAFDLEGEVINRDALDRALANGHGRELVLWVCGYSYQEITEIAGIGINTLKSRIRRGRETLAEKIKPAVIAG